MKFDMLDVDNSVQGTIINVSPEWFKMKTSLLGHFSDAQLKNEELLAERNKAFDLLDALSRGGAVVMEANFHVIHGTVHTFDKTLLDTVIQANINPIEKVERSLLIAASTIYNVPVKDLISPEHLDRVQAASPHLFALDS